MPKISCENENFSKEISKESPKLGYEGGLLMENEKAEKKLKKTH